MITATPRLYTLSLDTRRAWLAALAFIAGNLVFPQLAHLIPQGGHILLPIYFFTLIGAYKYGVQVGIVTAIASPLINSAMFGMPVVQMLPVMVLKGLLLAIFAGYAARRFHRATLLILAAVVCSYQLIGCAIEAIAHQSITVALQDFFLGIPGMILQIIGGWLFVNHLIRR